MRAPNLAQALDLLEDPARAGSWNYADPVLLQAQGSSSALVARLIADSGLGAADARILDVGTGVGGLAVAFATTFPESTIVGVDPWEPALALARERVASAGLDGRITLLSQTVQEVEDPDGFDLAWLPSFFIPEAVLDTALARIETLMRPDGTLILGLYDATDDGSLASAVHGLFIVRAGGSVVYPEDARARLQRAGFDDVRELERDWDAPLRLVVGRRG